MTVAVFAYMTVDLGIKATHFADPANRERPIEAWMSPRYVVHSWQLTKASMFQAMGYDPATPLIDLPRTMGDVVRETGMTLDQLQDRIKTAKRQQEGEAP